MVSFNKFGQTFISNDKYTIMLINEVVQSEIQRIDIPQQYRFKCVFILGSPGSGKSYYVENVLGLPEVFRIEDLDNVMAALKFKEYTPQHTEYAWSKLKERRKLWTQQGIPLACVSTGKNLQRTVREARELQAIGYDIFGLYVFTELQTALDRAARREIAGAVRRDIGRKTDPKYIENVYNILSKTRNEYNDIFWSEFSGFSMLLNTPWVDPFNRINIESKKLLNVFLRQPLYNRRGRRKLGLRNR